MLTNKNLQKYDLKAEYFFSRYFKLIENILKDVILSWNLNEEKRFTFFKSLKQKEEQLKFPVEVVGQ